MANENKGSAKPAAEKAEKNPSPFTVLRPVAPERIVAEPVAEGAEPTEPKPLYEVVGEFTSKTSKGAIALAIGEHGGGKYVAVPKRSFVERGAEPVGAPRLKWS